jgi:hypothetical protein
MRPTIFKKLKQLLKKTIFSESYLCFVQNLRRTIFISKHLLDNPLIGLTGSNHINFHKIMCSSDSNKC